MASNNEARGLIARITAAIGLTALNIEAHPGSTPYLLEARIEVVQHRPREIAARINPSRCSVSLNVSILATSASRFLPI